MDKNKINKVDVNEVKYFVFSIISERFYYYYFLKTY